MFHVTSFGIIRMEADTAKAADAVWLELHAEQISIAKRQRVGEVVRVSSQTRTREVLIDEPLAHEGVVVERIPVGRYVDAVPPIRQEGDITIVPIVEEEVVVTKRLVLREEVHLHRTRTITRHTETVSLREQFANVRRFPAEPGDASPGALVNAGVSRPEQIRRNVMDEETVVAVYDTPAAADAAVADLRTAKVPESAISRHSGPATGTGAGVTATTQPAQEKGFWSNLFGGESGHERDAAVYDRSMQSGSSVVVVKSTPEHDVEAVIAILERHSPIDIDERAAGYGLTTGETTAGATAMGATTMGATTMGTARPGMAATGMAAGDALGARTGNVPGAMRVDTVGTGGPATATRTDDGGMMQLSEEQLSVGKRLVNRGGTRIRRYVVETPVEENVSLHSERVTLDRHPVTDGRPVTDGSFSEKTIEMTETAEEAVVSKTARVVEEVGLRREASDRVETVRDNVRKEEVKIEQVPGATAPAGAERTATSPVRPKV